MGFAREEDRTPDTTPQKTLMTMVSSVGKETRNYINKYTHTHTYTQHTHQKQPKAHKHKD